MNGPGAKMSSRSGCAQAGSRWMKATASPTLRGEHAASHSRYLSRSSGFSASQRDRLRALPHHPTDRWSCRCWPTPGQVVTAAMPCAREMVGVADAREHAAAAASGRRPRSG